MYIYLPVGGALEPTRGARLAQYELLLDSAWVHVYMYYVCIYIYIYTYKYIYIYTCRSAAR